MTGSLFDILLVEDSTADCDFILAALGENNFANRVKVLRDGEEAFDYIFRTGQYKDCGMCDNPRLILLDLNLPKINGLEILKKIRSDEGTRMIPVVVLTSSLSDKDKIESYKLGANSYIVKPVRFDYFVQVIAEIGSYWALLNKAPFDNE